MVRHGIGVNLNRIYVLDPSYVDEVFGKLHAQNKFTGWTELDITYNSDDYIRQAVGSGYTYWPNIPTDATYIRVNEDAEPALQSLLYHLTTVESTVPVEKHPQILQPVPYGIWGFIRTMLEIVWQNIVHPPIVSNKAYRMSYVDGLRFTVEYHERRMQQKVPYIVFGIWSSNATTKYDPHMDRRVVVISEIDEETTTTISFQYKRHEKYVEALLAELGIEYKTYQW